MAAQTTTQKMLKNVGSTGGEELAPARVAQDIRGYYELAALELAEHTPAAWQGYRWYRDETEAGKVIGAAQAAMKASGEKEGLWRFLMPLDTTPG